MFVSLKVFIIYFNSYFSALFLIRTRLLGTYVVFFLCTMYLVNFLINSLFPGFFLLTLQMLKIFFGLQTQSGFLINGSIVDGTMQV